MNRPRPHQLLLGTLALLIAAAIAAWSFGPDTWRRSALGWLGLGPPEHGRPAVRVEVAPARREAVADTVASVGTLRARESVALTSEVSGDVRAIHFEEGGHVAAGDLLLELDADEQRARLARARAELENARLDLERARDLRSERAIAEAELDRLEAAYQGARAEVDLAEAELAERHLRAPFTGRIGLREVSPGTLVSPGTRIADLYAIDPLELRFALSERLLHALHPGLELTARTDAFPGERFTGEVIRVEPAVDPDTREITLEAELPNADGRLRPGLFMNVELVLERRSDALVVPEEAVLRRGDETFVYLVGDDGRIARREVRLGVRRPGSIEIREGLAEGERVVVGGLQKVAPGAAVEVVGGPPAGDDAGAAAGDGASG